VPVFRSGQAPPAWCELEGFELIDLPEGASAAPTRRGRAERLLVGSGTIQVATCGHTLVLKEAQFLDIGAAATYELRACSAKAQIIRLFGRWGRDLGGCGIFRVAEQEKPVNIGDPVRYPKRTSVDSHYHDCDEYWIILEGSGSVVVGDMHMKVAPGDCVPIGMGRHHDMPLVSEPVRAVFFETTLERQKRVGHLWAHTHGPAVPAAERI
jgi:mannose-6-phosphate isomerase-like protein (cupin superfamily)